MYVIKKENMSVPLKIWSEEGTIDSNCLEQMERVSSLPFLHKHVALMPDAHLGIGASIGSVVATKGVVLPVLVGVDIGCGLCCIKTSLKDIDTSENPYWRMYFRDKILDKLIKHKIKTKPHFQIRTLKDLEFETVRQYRNLFAEFTEEEFERELNRAEKADSGNVQN